jgi:hypothetical protein
MTGNPEYCSAKMSNIIFGKPFASSRKLTEEQEMEYQLEIYGPGSYDKDECIKVFISTSPFLPVRAGDLLNASTWASSGSKLLRVLNVEHVISEKSMGGIDPSGRIIHRALIYTQGVVDNACGRHESHPASHLG